MENIECKNCGSTEFNIDTEQIICLYCATPYIKEETNQEERLLIQSKFLNKIILGTIFGAVLVFFIGIFAFSSIKSQHIVEVQKASPDSKLSQEEYGYKYIKDASGWSQQIFDDIKLAKKQLNDNGQWGNYRNGELYNNLIQQVGEPSSLHEDKEDTEVTAIWKQNPTSHHILWIHVIFDKKSGMILDKRVQGWSSE